MLYDESKLCCKEFYEELKSWIEVMNKFINSKESEESIAIGSVVHPSIIRDSSILLRNSENLMKRYKESIDKIIEEYNNSMNLYPNSIDLYFNDSVIYYLLSECEYENVYKFY